MLTQKPVRQLSLPALSGSRSPNRPFLGWASALDAPRRPRRRGSLARADPKRKVSFQCMNRLHVRLEIC